MEKLDQVVHCQITYGALEAYLVPNRKKLAQPLQKAEETSEATNSKCVSLEKTKQRL